MAYWAYENEDLVSDDPQTKARKWLAHSLTERAPSTVRRRKASIAEYLKFLGEDPVLKFKLPGAPPPDPHPLPGGMADLHVMLAVAPMNQTILLVLCGKLGLRVSEAITAKYPDYDPIKRALEVFGKGGKYRVLPVSDYVHDVLMAEMATGRPDLRFAPFANTTARMHIREMAAEAGLEGVSSHDLRATFATDMYQRTKDILVVQQWLGHSSPETTRRYVEVKLDAMRAAL